MKTRLSITGVGLATAMAVLGLVLLMAAGPAPALGSRPASPAPAPQITPTPSPGCPDQFNWIPGPNTRLPAELRGVAAIASNDVWAVGLTASDVLHEHWDGQQITTPSPTPMAGFAQYFDGIDAVSSSDVWAVGWYEGSMQGTLTERWNGTQWVNMYSPNGAGYWNVLNGVEALSGSDVWAVGVLQATQPNYHPATLVLHWNGSQWSVVPSPNADGNGQLNGVSAAAPDDVWAVGFYTDSGGNRQPLILHSGPSGWEVVPVSGLTAPAVLQAVKAISPTDIWAVGYSILPGTGTRTLVLHWDGAQWNPIDIPSPGARDYLFGIDARGPGDVWVAGYTVSAPYTTTLAMRWDGAAWTRVPSSNPDPQSSGFKSISLLPSGEAYAVGFYGSGSSSHALFEAFADVPCVTPSPTPQPSATRTPTATRTPAATSTLAATATPAATTTPAATGTPTVCPVQFTDVPVGSTFYPYIRCLACRGVVSGYDDGTFRPNNNIIRGQMAKVVSQAEGYNDPIPPDRQTYADVLPTNTFWLWIERLTLHRAMNGYPCGGPGEPCDPLSRPHFRPYNNATRSQAAKIVVIAAGWPIHLPPTPTFADVLPDSPFYSYIETAAYQGIVGGYPCGGPGEPCDPQSRPYFHPYGTATRAQTAKIAANAFYPDCYTPARR